MRPATAASGPPPEVERLYAAIAALPPRQAAVVTLRKLLQLEYEEWPSAGHLVRIAGAIVGWRCGGCEPSWGCATMRFMRKNVMNADR